MQLPVPHSPFVEHDVPWFFVHVPAWPALLHDEPVGQLDEPQQTEFTQVSPDAHGADTEHAAPCAPPDVHVFVDVLQTPERQSPLTMHCTHLPVVVLQTPPLQSFAAVHDDAHGAPQTPGVPPPPHD
jgi:hypothetical protein